jgi:hypothetical protein
MSLQQQSDPRAERFVLLYVGRKKGLSEEKLAERLGFSGDPYTMYGELAHEGSPVCPRCGDLYPDEDHECRKLSTKGQVGGRKARRGGGEAEELPPAADAIDLFQAAIDCLKDDLAYITHLEEELQDGRFLPTLYYPKEAEMHPDVYVRELVSPERWEELCAEQGEDPDSTDTLYVHMDRRFVGKASPWPDMHLVRLIGAYLLCARSWNEIELLLERLHRRSREPDIEKIKRHLTGETPRRDRDDALLPITRRLAKLVRGGEVKRGLDPGPLDSVDHTVARHIRHLREQGVPEEDIRSVMREEHKVPEDEISRLSTIFPPHHPE